MRPDGEPLRDHLRLTPAERALLREQAQEMRVYLARLITALDNGCEAMDAVLVFTHVLRDFEYMQNVMNKAVHKALV